ncbi:MAG: MBL fold metallo-hydrolase, partial [Deltaproteobacteria bacterium]
MPPPPRAATAAPPPPSRRRFRRHLRGGAAVLSSAGLLAVLGLLADGWTAFGHRATGGERLARMHRSPQWTGKRFENPEPLWNDFLGMLTAFGRTSPVAEPDSPLPVVRGAQGRFDTFPASGVRVTWLGHSTTLIEVDGKRFLTDPIFGGRASPFDWVGPKTWYDPPIPLDELPPIDAVLISHDHYDHLQMSTIQALRDTDTPFVVPLGVGAHLEYWGIDPARITELDWWESTRFGDVEVTATPARHASGRFLTDRNATLWAGYAVAGPAHRVFFSGDTGLFPGMKEIGERLGPFDIAMVEVGAYDKTWPDWHSGPEQAVLAHQWLRGEVFLPIHWGLWS